MSIVLMCFDQSFRNLTACGCAKGNDRIDVDFRMAEVFIE